MHRFLNFNLILSFLVVFLGLLSYEYHLYHGFYFFLSVFSFLILMVLALKDGICKKIYINKFVVILIVFFIIATLFSSIINFDLSGVLRSFITLLAIFIVINFIEKDEILEIFFKLFGVIGFILSIISIAIEFDLLSFWIKPYERNSSIFFDPNYAAAIIGVSFFCIIFYIDNKLIKIFMAFFAVIGLFLTYSKGAIFSFLLSIFVMIFRRVKLYFSIPLFSFIFLILYILFNSVNLDMFRAEQAFNNRDVMWRFVYASVLHEQNLFGFGESGLSTYLVDNGLVNTSTHNAFMDVLGKYGVFSLVVYFLLIFYAIFKGFLNNDKNLPFLIFLIVMSNSITYSVGGIGLLSIIISIVLFKILINGKKV